MDTKDLFYVEVNLGIIRRNCKFNWVSYKGIQISVSKITVPHPACRFFANNNNNKKKKQPWPAMDGWMDDK